MTTTHIYCPKCSRKYLVYKDARTYFFCGDCQTAVIHNGDRSDLPTEDPIRNQETISKSMNHGKARAGLWLISSLLLYLIISFSQYELDIAEWSAIARGILIVGILGLGFLTLIIDFE